MLIFNFCDSLCRCGYDPYALIAHSVKHNVELPPLRAFLGCLVREKELVYRYIVTGNKFIENL